MALTRDLRFLHINASDTRWGASKAGYRFHRALQDGGIASRLLCAVKQTDDPSVFPIVPGRYGYLANAAAGLIWNTLGIQSFGYPASFFLRRSPLVMNWADVIILRDLHWWYFSLESLLDLACHAPLIWRVPDMWPVTGHCCYSYSCDRWRTGCGRCPDLHQPPGLLFDTTHALWQRKRRILARLTDRLIFASPSQWLAQILKTSPVTAPLRVEVIPTAVDLSIFRPGDKAAARAAFGIPQELPVIMFSAVKLNDPRKGAADFFSLIRTVQQRTGQRLVVLIPGAGRDLPRIPDVLFHRTGQLADDRRIALCYNASDIFISTSTADNLPNTLVEAAACGRAVVTYDRGGCREALVSAETGYAVQDLGEMAERVAALIGDTSALHRMGCRARRFAEERFSMDGQVRAYTALAAQLTVSGMNA